MPRSGRAQSPPNDDADLPAEREVEIDESDYTIHQPGTFPASGRNVAYRLQEGKTISGRFRAELSWDLAASPQDIVIHLSAFLVGEDSQVPKGNPYYCVNHDNDRSKDGSVVRRGRRQHGRVVEEERITVALDDVDEDVTKIVFVAYIQDADSLSHTFHGLVGGRVTILQLPLDDDLPGEVVQIDEHLLDGDYFDKDTAVLVGEVYRRENERRERVWVYRDIGQGRDGLRDVGDDYGVVFI